MKTSTMESSLASQKPMDESHTKMADSAWKPLYRIGAVAALIMVVFIVIEIPIYLAWPPPSTVIGYFTLFQNNRLLGLLNLDLLLMHRDRRSRPQGRRCLRSTRVLLSMCIMSWAPLPR
jgi:hypothetical protein